MNNLLYYAAIVILIAGLIVGVAYALQARREAREGVSLISETDMLSEFQRARDAGEMDEAEFRRIRDLLILGKSSNPGDLSQTGPIPEVEGRPPEFPRPSGRE